MSIERRYNFAKIEPRMNADGTASRTIAGYGAVFNKPSNILRSSRGDFVEIIEPGAFDGVLNDDVRALFNHEANLILARSNAGKGTLKIFQDSSGLGYEFEAPPTSAGNDIFFHIQARNIDASSFAFELKTGGDSWERRDGVLTRTIKAGGISRLHDVSPVTYPAYNDASVTVRSLDDFLNAEKGEENQTPTLSYWDRRIGFLIK